MTPELIIVLGIVVVAIVLLTLPTRTSEGEAAKKLAHKYGGEAEVEMPDGTEVALLNSDYAFSVEKAKRWAEAIGTALYHAMLTGRQPAVLLLVDDEEEERKYLLRCQAVCRQSGIALFVEIKGQQNLPLPPKPRKRLHGHSTYDYMPTMPTGYMPSGQAHGCCH